MWSPFWLKAAFVITVSETRFIRLSTRFESTRRIEPVCVACPVAAAGFFDSDLGASAAGSADFSGAGAGAASDAGSAFSTGV